MNASKKADSLIQQSQKKLYYLSNIDDEGVFFNEYDKIITFDNEVLVVKITQVTMTEVRFLYPLNLKSESVNRDNVSQILYANGKIDLFIPFEEENQDSLTMKVNRLIIDEQRVWEKIMITENEIDVTGFKEIGNLTSVFLADRFQVTNQYLDKNCEIILKKRAANVQADCILIKKRTYNKGYGELPSLKLEGIAYKYQ